MKRKRKIVKLKMKMSADRISRAFDTKKVLYTRVAVV